MAVEGIALSTIGATLSYAMEATAGTRPLSGYSKIVGAKSIPEIGSTTETIEVSTIEDEYKVYVPGQKDTGGELSFTFSANDVHIENWEAMREEAETGQATNKRMWFAIAHPKMTNAFYFAGMPSKLGFGGMEANSAFDQPSAIIPSKVEGWATKPTSSI